MKKAWMNYRAFTKRWYRCLVLVLFPLMGILCTVGLGLVHGELAQLGILIYYCLLMIADPMSDFSLLGGFYKRNNALSGFLQSSNYFEELMHDVVLMDIVRRTGMTIGTHAVICLVAYLFDKEAEFHVVLWILPLLHILISEADVLVARHFTTWNFHYGVVVIGFILEVALLIALLHLEDSVIVFILTGGISGFLAVLMALGIIRYTKKKVRDSYYD